MKNTIYFIFILFTLFTSCKRTKKEEKDNEQETITTVKLELTGNSQTQTFVWKDTDGAGAAVPIIDSIILKPNTAYSASLYFLDERKKPVDDVTTEVQEESDAHQVFYTISNSNIEIITLDKDKNAKPLGLKTEWNTKAGAGNVSIVLKHQPDGKTGNSTSGETDAEVIFPFTLR